MGDFAGFTIQCQLQITKVSCLTVGLHNECPGIRVNHRLRGTRIGMTCKQNVYAFDCACQCDIGINVPLQAWIAFSIGLHRCGFALVSQQYNEVHLVTQFINRFLYSNCWTFHIQWSDKGRDNRGHGILSHDTDHTDAYSIPLDDCMCLGIWVIGVLIEKIGTEDGERRPVLLPCKHLVTVLELMVTNGHGVIPHGDHQFKSKPAFGQLCKGTCEYIPGIKQEDVWLLLAYLFNERGYFCNTTNHRNVIEPECRDRIIGTFDIVGKQQCDGFICTGI